MTHRETIRRLLRTPCTIVTRQPSGTDEYGDDTYDDVTVVLDGDPGCHVQPLSSDELADRPDGSVRWRGWFPPDVVLASTSAIDVAGMRLEVVGPPRPWSRPGGDVAYVEADLTDRREG